MMIKEEEEALARTCASVADSILRVLLISPREQFRQRLFGGLGAESGGGFADELRKRTFLRLNRSRAPQTEECRDEWDDELSTTQEQNDCDLLSSDDDFSQEDEDDDNDLQSSGEEEDEEEEEEGDKQPSSTVVLVGEHGEEEGVAEVVLLGEVDDFSAEDDDYGGGGRGESARSTVAREDTVAARRVTSPLRSLSAREWRARDSCTAAKVRRVDGEVDAAAVATEFDENSFHFAVPAAVLREFSTDSDENEVVASVTPRVPIAYADENEEDSLEIDTEVQRRVLAPVPIAYADNHHGEDEQWSDEDMVGGITVVRNTVGAENHSSATINRNPPYEIEDFSE